MTQQISLQAAIGDARAGMSRNALMLKYHIGFAREAAVASGQELSIAADRAADQGLATEDATGDEGQCFELHIDLAEEAIDEVLCSLSDTELESQDKATIVQLALQRKLNGFAQPNPAETETDNAEARPDPS